MHRLFVAIELPDEVKRELARIALGVPGARWLEGDELHLTLRFIGEVDGDVFRDVLECLSEIEAAPFELTLRGVGHFPPRGEPRILWVGVEKSEPLIQLRHKVEGVLVRAGLPPEKRKFSPHVSVARLKYTPIEKVGGYLTAYGLFRAGPFPVEQFCLFSSQLGAKRAVYRLEEAYRLDAAPAEPARSVR
jgi:2'-5' RNA ligase